MFTKSHLRPPTRIRNILQPGVTTKLYSTPIAGGYVEARVDPVSTFQPIVFPFSQPTKGHSERERHILHEEILALQTFHAISYKDAAHRLFMAELERVKKADSAEQSFAAIRRSFESLVTSDIIPPIDAIDKGELDDYLWRDGKWWKRSESRQ